MILGLQLLLLIVSYFALRLLLHCFLALQKRRRLSYAASGTIIDLTSGPWYARRTDDPSFPWLSCTLPNTALGVLIFAGHLPDPYIGVNNHRIPDIYHIGRSYYTFTFRKTFSLPSLRPSSKIWLHFKGINYAIRDIRLNGTVLAPPLMGCGVLTGMYVPHAFNLTSDVSDDINCLEVTVEPPVVVGNVDRGGQGGDHRIAENVTAQYVAGWDWQQPIADRNTGIWDSVYLHVTGPISLRDPHIRVSGDKLENMCYYINASVLLDGCIPAGTTLFLHCRLMFEGRCVHSWEPVTITRLLDDEKSSVAAAAAVVQLPRVSLQEPKVWWPVGMGDQPLYEIQMNLWVGEGEGVGENQVMSLSDALSERFGVRTITSIINEDGGRQFYVNNLPVFIRGGNWTVTEGMLRCSDERCLQSVKLAANAGLNMLRLWGGASCERGAFFDACDELGVLVWHDFWITGDCNGRGATPESPLSDSSWPSDHKLFLRSAEARIKSLRNRPCIALWCGGNEQKPAPDLDTGLRGLVTLLDPSGCYVSGSLWSGFGAGDGALCDGPYLAQNPDTFFDPTFIGTKYPFNPEVGSFSMPELESMLKIFPNPDERRIPLFKEEEGGEDAHSAWMEHTFLPHGGPGTPNQLLLYFTPTTLEEYCELAQLASYVQYKALFEGWASRMWDPLTGVLLWKVNNPWTGLRGQLWDYFLQPTGGYYGVKAAIGSDLHAQYNPYRATIEVVNTGRKERNHVSVRVAVYSMSNGIVQDQRHLLESVPPMSTRTVTLTSVPSDLPVYFLYLKVINGERNIYWLHQPHAEKCAVYKPLVDHCKQSPNLMVTMTTAHTGKGCLNITLFNTHDTSVAFWMKLRCADGSGKTVPGVLYSDNYCTLVPQEEVLITIEKCQQQIRYVELTGWNCIPITLKV